MTAPTPPTLTAVVATYNNRPILERYLAAWERFAAGQPVEVVVVAAGCTDDTEAFLAERARRPAGVGGWARTVPRMGRYAIGGGPRA